MYIILRASSILYIENNNDHRSEEDNKDKFNNNDHNV